MRWLIFSLAIILAGSRPAAAQGGTDILTGVVTNEQGQPVAEAIVEALSLESGVSRTARTDARGRYTILFPDGGGQYRFTVRFIGMVPIQRTIVRQGDEDRLVTNFRMSTTPQRLEDVVVRGRAGPPRGEGPPTPGSTERVLNPDQTARLPIDASDLTLLASLVPGVVITESTDSTPAGFSIAGQRPTANNITLDGLSFGASQVPQEAIRNTRVITSSYDVARGQFSVDSSRPPPGRAPTWSRGTATTRFAIESWRCRRRLRIRSRAASPSTSSRSAWANP